MPQATHTIDSVMDRSLEFMFTVDEDGACYCEYHTEQERLIQEESLARQMDSYQPEQAAGLQLSGPGAWRSYPPTQNG